MQQFGLLTNYAMEDIDGANPIIVKVNLTKSYGDVRTQLSKALGKKKVFILLRDHRNPNDHPLNLLKGSFEEMVRLYKNKVEDGTYELFYYVFQ